MKKVFSLLLSLVLIATAFSSAPIPFGVAAFDPSKDLIYDVDGDNTVSFKDITTLSRYHAGWSNIAIVKQKVDINNDGEENYKDITYLSRLLAGWDLEIDYTVNNPSFTWPTINVTDAAAGTPFLTTDQVSNASGSLKNFLLTSNNNPALPFNVACHISGTTVTALVPAGINLSAMKVDFLYSGKEVLQDNIPVYPNTTEFNFTKPVTLTLIANDNSTTEIKVYVMTMNTGIPSMAITTDQMAGINSKVDTVNCNVFAGGGNREKCFYANKIPLSAAATVKGRGWTSWYYYDKKSYTIKFNDKQQLFDLPVNKEWVLSANFADRSLLRNAVAMQMAHNVGIESVMDVRFVDLWVDGVYNGCYQLIEKINVGPDRVNITDFDPSLEPEQVGFILETNGHNKAEGEFGTYTNGQDADRPSTWTHPFGPTSTYDPYSGDIFFTSKYAAFNYKSIFVINKPSDNKLLDPAVNGQKYYDYIYNYMDQLEGALSSRNYTLASQYLDMESMAKYYIVEETTMNTDSQLHCSCYMYKDAGEKLKMGPLWDFDLGFGNGENAYNTSISYLDTKSWFKDLVAMPQFKALVKSIWNTSKTDLNTSVTTYIDNTSTLLQGSQAQNYKKWPITQYAKWIYPTVLTYNSYSAQVNYVKTFMSQKMTYMNNKISQW